MYTIKENSFPLQPRERLAAYGAHHLSEQELLAILLRTGTRHHSVYELAGLLLKKFESLSEFRRASLDELKEVTGIGDAKAAELKAMMELGKRIQASSHLVQGQVTNSRTFSQQLIAEMSDLEQEHLVAIYLDNKNRILQKKTVFIGTVNSSLAVPREILHHAVKLMATSLIVAHNHPSGMTEPSSDDEKFTTYLAFACKAVGCKLIDHLIIGHQTYFSFCEKQLL